MPFGTEVGLGPGHIVLDRYPWGITYKCLHGLAPPYLSRYCQPLSAHSGPSQLLSAEVHQLFVPRIRTTVMGSGGFYYAAPASWNDLPPLLRDPDLTLTDFRLIMKTVLF